MPILSPGTYAGALSLLAHWRRIGSGLIAFKRRFAPIPGHEAAEAFVEQSLETVEREIPSNWLGF